MPRRGRERGRKDKGNHVHVTMTAAAAAKSLLSCPALSGPIDGSPPGSPRPRDSPGKNTGVGLPFPSPMHESEK